MSDDWAEVKPRVREGSNRGVSQQQVQPRATNEQIHDGVRRRYLNLIAEYLVANGPLELGALGNKFKRPAELTKSLIQMLKDESSVFQLKLHGASSWWASVTRLNPRLPPSGVPHSKIKEKTVMCVEWRLNGTCSFGASCWFAHSASEQRIAISKASAKAAYDAEAKAAREAVAARSKQSAATAATAPLGARGARPPATACRNAFEALALADEVEVEGTLNDSTSCSAPLKAPLAEALVAAELRQYIIDQPSGRIVINGDDPWGSMLLGFLKTFNRARATELQDIVGSSTHPHSISGVPAFAANHHTLLLCTLVGAEGLQRLSLPSACKKEGWEMLTDDEQDAARVLGYDKCSWESGLVPAECLHGWQELDDCQRCAAIRLGYYEESWTEELREEDGVEHQVEQSEQSSSWPCLGVSEALAVMIERAEDEELERHSQISSVGPSTTSVTHMSLKGKADAIKSELGIEPTVPMPKAVEEAIAMLGEPFSGSLAERVSSIYAALFY